MKEGCDFDLLALWGFGINYVVVLSLRLVCAHLIANREIDIKI